MSLRQTVGKLCCFSLVRSNSAAVNNKTTTKHFGFPLLLSCRMQVQERDPRSYQIYLQLPDGTCFLGSTPEQLYIRSGSHVASEAVAATRPRGPAGRLASEPVKPARLCKTSKDPHLLRSSVHEHTYALLTEIHMRFSWKYICTSQVVQAAVR